MIELNYDMPPARRCGLVEISKTLDQIEREIGILRIPGHSVSKEEFKKLQLGVTSLSEIETSRETVST